VKNPASTESVSSPTLAPALRGSPERDAKNSDAQKATGDLTAPTSVLALTVEAVKPTPASAYVFPAGQVFTASRNVMPFTSAPTATTSASAKRSVRSATT
jgi:hypothetical protein